MNEEDAQAYLDLGITANEVAKLRYLDANDEKLAHILWEHTPFPLTNGLLDIVEAIAALPDEPCTSDCWRPALLVDEDGDPVSWYDA